LNKAWRIGAVIAVAICAGLGGYILRHESRNEANRSKAVQTLFALNLPDPTGANQALMQWRGKILVVNFWATWCEPCREEIPGLGRIREKYAGKNLEIVGIAVDSVTKVREYAKEVNIAYPLLIGGLESIELARSLGNAAGGLPFSIVLDPQSGIVFSHLGLIQEQDLDRRIAALAH